MLALPLSKELQSVAHYYQAVCAWKQGDAEAARHIFDFAINQAPRQYQAQGLLTAGATCFSQGEYSAALAYYVAAARAAGDGDLAIFAASQKMAAVVQSLYGDHRQALDNLERLFPAVRAIARQHPGIYYDFLNSYAIELGEAGRLAEAQNVCALTLASPLATAYPECEQTRDELAAKRTAATPSTIAVPARAPDILAAPQAQVESAATPARARSTISFKLRRRGSLTRPLTIVPVRTILSFVSTQTSLDWLAESSLPRGPPARF